MNASRLEEYPEADQLSNVRRMFYVSLTSPLKTINTNAMSSTATHEVTNGPVHHAIHGKPM
jgi:hypothetical protein